MSTVKPKDYENDAPVEALTVYAAWELLRGSERPLQLGDILEDESGGLYICKYIGFEEARWFVAVAAELAPVSVPVSVPASQDA